MSDKNQLIKIAEDNDRKKLLNQFIGTQPELVMTYDKPAADWETEAIALGNGFIGAMAFSEPNCDRLQINEHSLWSGGPGADPSYNGGHTGTAEENRAALDRVRNLLQEKMSEYTKTKSAYKNENGEIIAGDYSPESDEIQKNLRVLMGEKSRFGTYQTLGDIFIKDLSETVDYTNYKRSLDLDNAVLKMTYVKSGVRFKRKYFISYPDNIMAIKISTDKEGMINHIIEVSTEQKKAKIETDDNTIILSGQPGDQNEDGLKFAQYIKIINIGGTTEKSENGVAVKNADKIYIIMSAATNYKQSKDENYEFFNDLEPVQEAKGFVEKAIKKSFDDLLKVHIEDYRNLFDRVKINLFNIRQKPKKTTDKLLDGYKLQYRGGESNTVEENRYLEILYYQFGRYLLIASSREGGLPANLQGIWAQGLNPPWDADYHTNINLQMNYWLAQQTNLAECHLPNIEYIESLVPRAKFTAKQYYCKQDGSDVRGWVIHHENNIWANTAASSYYGAFYFPAAAAWCCFDIWEYYLFTQDKKFLAKHYDTLLGAALFWVDNLWTDARDGTLVANPSYSPEHGEYSLGASCDQEIIWEIFEQAICASRVLEKSTSETDEIKVAQSKLHMPKIGLAGEYLEWKDEIKKDITGDGQHRHVNHLYALHPGTFVVAGRSGEDDKNVAAMKNVLHVRGDGGTGWSKAWKINFWARLRDGNHAAVLVNEIISAATNPNLFDMHPPFQIDGNFGAVAGMTEMLLQSQGNSIDILAALPDKWSKGFVSGIKARGNFELAIKWNESKAEFIRILSNAGADCVIRLENLSEIVVYNLENGEKTGYEVMDKNTIKIKTNKNCEYILIP